MADRIVDDEKLKEMAKLITDVIYVYSSNAQKEIDQKFKLQLAYSVSILTHIYGVLNEVINCPDKDRISDIQFESQSIIWQACNSMIGAIQLIRQGYPLEPQFLMRSAFESLALAVSFHFDKSLFEKYNKLGLSGNKCISYLKHIVKNAGEIYGTLSMVTHPSRRTTGSHYNPDMKTIIIGGGYTEKLSNRTLTNFSIANFILLTIWQCVEFIFFDFNKSQHFWKRTELAYESDISDSVKTMHKEILNGFRSALKDLE